MVCLLVASANPSRAHACRVHLFGAADAHWRGATEQLALNAVDCAALHVEVEGRRALVTLIREDGKRVARALAAPAELHEAIEALKLADPDQPAPPSAPRVEGEAAVAPTTSTRPARRATSVMLGLMLGVRAGELVSPVIDTSLLVRIRSWELAVIIDRELAYFQTTGRAGLLGRGVTPGLGFARRQQLAQGELLLGVRLGLGVLRSRRIPPFSFESSAPVINPFPVVTEYQGRLAAFVGYALPLHPLVRLRMELSGDAVWRSTLPGYSMGPYWALGTKIGIEFGDP